MTARSTFAQNISPEDARDTLNSLMFAGVRIASVAAFALLTPDPSVANVIVESYQSAGDAPPCRYRRTTNATEATYPSARTDALGGKWIIDEDKLFPEWFGAKGNSNGYSVTNPNVLLAGASGADDAPAFRAADIYAEATGKECETMAGKTYRFGSHTTAKSGQKSVLVPGSKVRWRFRSLMTHDSYDPVEGGVMFIFTNGTKADPVRDVQFIFDGGRLDHLDDAVPPVRQNGTKPLKGSITIYQAFNAKVLRVQKSGQAPTNFQVSVFNSSLVWVDGGAVGYPVAPFNGQSGDDGVHVIVSGNGNACRDVWIDNVRSRSGDDPLSITAELNAVNCTIERIYVDGLSCETDKANLIKIHIVNDTAQVTDPAKWDNSNGNIIRKVYITTHIGTFHGNVGGAGCTVSNDRRDKNNIIREVYVDGLDVDMGAFPKTQDTTGTLRGNTIRVTGSDEIHFTGASVLGQQNSMLLFYECNDCSFEGTLANDLANNSNAALVTGLTVSKAMNQGNFRRIYFSGSPDLSAVATQVGKWSGDIVNAVNDNKLPILTMTGMATAGHNGSFVIRAVDAANYTVDVENYRSGVAEEPAATGAASISTGQMPVINLTDCTGTKVHARVVNPLSWAVAFSGGRKALNVNNEIVVELENQTFGYGIYSVRSRLSRYGFKTDATCRSGSIGMYGAPGGSGLALTPYNHFLDSDDFAALADGNMGFGRTVLSEYPTDRYDRIRGRTPTVLRGTVTQKAGNKGLGTVSAGPPVTYGGIGANASTFGGPPRSAIDPSFIRSLSARSTGHGGIDSLTWDQANVRFNITTLAEPTADITWDYVLAFPD